MQQDLRSRVQHAGKRGVAERLAADLVGLPYVSRAEVRDRYSLSGQGAVNAINTLVDLGILGPAAFRFSRGQRYVAKDVVRILSD